MWCPECDREYRPGFTECFYCKVALTDVAPPEPVEPDHEVLEYDLSDWTDEQRDAVSMLLRGNDIEPAWQGTTLVVPRVHEVQADMAIDEVDATYGEPLDDIEVEPDAARRRVDEDPELASVARRVGAKVVDGLVGSVLFALLYASGVVGRRSPLFTAVGAVLEISCVALWGRTPGRFVLGTKVVDSADLLLPSWRSSFVRFVVPAGPGLALGAAGASSWSSLVALLWQLIVYVGLFTDPLRQGLHDKAARTITMRA